MEGSITSRRSEGRAGASELVERLLDVAGLTGPWALESVAEVGWINTNAVIRLGDGERVVVRTYGWPFDGEPRYDRATKEAWLHPQLAAAGVPVAEVLASATVEGTTASLLSWLPGETLGVVAQRVSAADLADAWAESGAALRRAHGVPVPTKVAGWLTPAAVLPMAGGTFGGFHEERITEHAAAAAAAHPGLGIDPAVLADLASRARPALDASPLTLGHSDSHPWNVLVAQDGAGRWRLSGWLDWEFAWVGDPAWDHMRLAVQRFADIGPTPDAWWDGYGGRPPALNLAVAILHFMLWKAVDAVDTRDRAVAHAWLADLPGHVVALEALLA